jgi:hypothetical protein
MPQKSTKSSNEFLLISSFLCFFVAKTLLVYAATPKDFRGAVRIAVPVTVTGVVPLVMLTALGPTAPHLHPATILLAGPLAERARVGIQASATARRRLSSRSDERRYRMLVGTEGSKIAGLCVKSNRVIVSQTS